MRTAFRITAAAGLVCVPLLTAGQALADTPDPTDSASASASAGASTGGTMSNVTPFGFQISPTTAAPGASIGLGVTGCDAGSASASSGVFNSVNLTSTGTKGSFSGTATIDTTAKVGAQYTVTFTCGSSSGTTTLTIASGSATTPTGTVTTGEGGAMGGGNSTEVMAGIGLGALALVGGGLLARRRSARR